MRSSSAVAGKWRVVVVLGCASSWIPRTLAIRTTALLEEATAQGDLDRVAGPIWDPHVQLDGHTAASRARWCVEHLGFSPKDAQARVMAEFPSHFSSGHPSAPFTSGGLKWDPAAMCGDHSAASRAKWCQEHLGLSPDESRRRVMREFPQSFSPVLVDVAAADPSALVWSDEFDYSGRPDPRRWGYDLGGHGWGNGELQHYTDRADNAWVADGSLHIRAVREPFGGNRFTSARLVTRGRFDCRYGRVEIRLKLPVGRGSWAAAWMLPTEQSYGEWPKSGEIDIIEHVGHDAGKVHGTVHTERFNHMKGTQVGRAIAVDASKWHTYAVEWSAEGVSFILDGKRYHRFQKREGGGWQVWPFDHPFHIILNLAVGGVWGGQKGVDEEAFAGEGQVMEVAWVRAYRLV